MNARIRIYIGRHLCTAPRPLKEADALAAAGFSVSVHGLWFDPRLVERDQTLLASRPWTFKPYADCRPGHFLRLLRWYRLRLSHRVAREKWRWLKNISPDVFSYGTHALVRHACSAPADLTIFHSEGGLFAAPFLRRAGSRVGVDFEDWFSRDLTDTEREFRPVEAIASLEAESIQRDIYTTTTSSALAESLATTYHGPVPTVVYNTFPLHEESVAGGRDRDDPTRVSLHWFSLSIGPARGLEVLFDALPLLTFPWELHLRGDDPLNYFPVLLARLPKNLGRYVHRHDTVPNAELFAHIAQHDVGLALDLPHCPSRDLTITNKLFQYLQAGLAVIANDTTGHREVLNQAPAAGTIVQLSSPETLASALETLCADRGKLSAAKAAASHAHATLFAHEYQAGHYAELATRALKEKS